MEILKGYLTKVASQRKIYNKGLSKANGDEAEAY